MALNPKYSTEAVNAKCAALTALLNGGFIDIYDGAQPATADTAITTQVKLARLTLANPAFAAPVVGVATANAIGTDLVADATGTATWARMRKSDESPVCDGSCGTSGANLNLGSTSIVAGAAVSVTGLTLTEPKG